MELSIDGETVAVMRRERVGTDRFGAPEWGAWVREEVPGVLAQVGGTADLEASRPAGVRADMTFHFPASYEPSLKGCRIEYRGRVYEVEGDPRPYAAANCPPPWNRAAEAVSVDG